jgi:hypothetical protein
MLPDISSSYSSGPLQVLRSASWMLAALLGGIYGVWGLQFARTSRRR